MVNLNIVGDPTFKKLDVFQSSNPVKGKFVLGASIFEKTVKKGGIPSFIGVNALYFNGKVVSDPRHPISADFYRLVINMVAKKQVIPAIEVTKKYGIRVDLHPKMQR